ncbi:MAG: hypothetical protein IJ341_06745 [Bacteroidales bacterium]|nr:hypothetical protein [Bacteroidales bacterium]
MKIEQNVFNIVWVDAVVTDANINLYEENDYDGLKNMTFQIEHYNQKRIIPFLLYSGRDNIKDVVDKIFLEYFEGRQFKKQDGIEPLINAIKESVLHINSKEFRIQNKYKAELEAASLIDGNQESLFNALLYEYSDDWKNSEDYFNPMRKIIESIFSECKKLKIIPNIEGLGAISRFLGKGEEEKYITIEGQEIMPKPLARSLWFFLDITQEGSHKKEDLTLGVEKYVRDTKNINLFRSILYIAMDMCLWFKTCKEEIMLPSFSPKWRLKDNIDEILPLKKKVKEPKYEIEGFVRIVDGKPCVGKYLLEYPKNNEYKEGDRVGIKSSVENTKNVFDYFDEESAYKVDRFVYLTKIKVLNNSTKEGA